MGNRTIKATTGISEPGARKTGLPMCDLMEHWHPDEIEESQRKALLTLVRGENHRQAYEAQVQLARRYRLRLPGVSTKDGQYEPGPFDRLPPGGQQEVLDLCNRPSHD